MVVIGLLILAHIIQFEISHKALIGLLNDLATMLGELFDVKE